MAFAIVDERYRQVANLNSWWSAFAFDNRFGRTYEKKVEQKKSAEIYGRGYSALDTGEGRRGSGGVLDKG